MPSIWDKFRRADRGPDAAGPAGSEAENATVADSARALSDAAAADPEGDGPLLDPEVKGVDARRLADLRAEEAGRRARREAAAAPDQPREEGGPQGLEPTRYGDWEKAGRCIDF